VTFDHVLDNPVWTSLNGPHRVFAETNGNARRYPTDVSPFLGLPADPAAGDWDDVAALVGSGGSFVMIGPHVGAPEGWLGDFRGAGVQLVATGRLELRPYDEAVVLGDDDAAEMLDLTARTKPGPFLERTHLMGTYLGVRREGRLVAMAGERLHPPGWTEISAVCTDPEFRGHGFGTRLVQAVAQTIVQRDEQPLMHAAASNGNAIRLYEALGFEIRTEVNFFAARVPGGQASARVSTPHNVESAAG
jgi:ribosomal protein S18 acetylase RimI-like enzyme